MASLRTPGPLTMGAVLLALAASLTAQPPAQPGSPAPTGVPDPNAGPENPAAGEAAPASLMDRLLFNAQERTLRGAQNLDEARYEAAAGAMESALSLAPDDPRASFNAGTARLPMAPERARQLLEAAAADASDPSLGARAHYNLGNLSLASSDFETAIDSYINALRKDPGFDDARFNLELARRRLEEQQQNQQNQDPQQNPQDQEQDPSEDQDQQERSDQAQQQNQDSEDQGESDNQQNQEQQDQEQQDPSEDQEQQEDQEQDSQDSQGQEPPQEEQEQSQDPQRQDPSGSGGEAPEESPLPQFEDLPDMSAEEAAAILQAIENLEREQRREQALEAAAATRASGKKDW